MTGKLVDIVNQLGLVCGHGGAADAPSGGDLDAGGLALEGTQNQLAAFRQIEAHPVDVPQGFIQHGGSIGQIGDEVGHAVCQGGDLRGDQGIEGRLFCRIVDGYMGHMENSFAKRQWETLNKSSAAAGGSFAIRSC